MGSSRQFQGPPMNSDEDVVTGQHEGKAAKPIKNMYGDTKGAGTSETGKVVTSNNYSWTGGGKKK